MKVLIDSSIWIEHFKKQNELIPDLITRNLIVTHPLIIAEIALGTPKNKKIILEIMKELNQTEQATTEEVLEFIEKENIAGQGCGATDIFLLTSAIITKNTAIWTLDKNLMKLTERFNVLYKPTLN